MLAGFLAVALMLVFWGVVLAPILNQRADNPRVVAQELNIMRGSIWASENVQVARTVGSEGDLEREYPFSYIGPAVGYYSFVHGTAGVENGYDAVLRGETADAWTLFWRDLLHLPQTGRDIRITLDNDWQRWATALMAENKGSVVMLTTTDMAVRVMLSHPAYDPNRLDADFETLTTDENGPLLNRAAQSQYQPGMALQPFLMAAGVANGDLDLAEQVIDAATPVQVNSGEVTCRTMPLPPETWATVLQNGCPAPMVALGEQWGAATLDGLFADFGFTSNPELPIDTETPIPLPVADPGLAAIGQDNLVVTPLQMSLALASLARGGELQQARLVTAVQNEVGEWQAIPHDSQVVEVVPATAAAEIVQTLTRPEVVIAEHVVVALSGPQEGHLVWYLGLAPAAEPLYAVVVVLEETNDITRARRVGRTLLTQVLAPGEAE
jgi:peptidoglycan glycosyltransferase